MMGWILALLLLGCVGFCGGLRADPLGRIFKPTEMCDAASLDLTVLQRSDYRSSAAPNRVLERVEIEFVSFQWQGEVWRHRATILIPGRIPDVYRGAGAVFSEVRPFDKTPTRDWAERTALMGVATLTVTSGNPGPHYGRPREANLMGHGQLQFQRTGDPLWVGYAWLGKVVVRAR